MVSCSLGIPLCRSWYPKGAGSTLNENTAQRQRGGTDNREKESGHGSRQTEELESPHLIRCSEACSCWLGDKAPKKHLII